MTMVNCNRMAYCNRRYITLIEIMIVMFLIALITGVLAYNYRGTLEEGKAFKTKVGIERVDDILNLKAAQDPDFLQNVDTWKEVIRGSPTVKDPDALIKDGWGEEYQVTVEDGNIRVRSRRYTEYLQSHQQSMFKQ